MSFVLPALPYAKDALAPHISAETVECVHQTIFTSNFASHHFVLFICVHFRLRDATQSADAAGPGFTTRSITVDTL